MVPRGAAGACGCCATVVGGAPVAAAEEPDIVVVVAGVAAVAALSVLWFWFCDAIYPFCGSTLLDVVESEEFGKGWKKLFLL